jgi:hypothetical protein
LSFSLAALPSEALAKEGLASHEALMPKNGTAKIEKNLNFYSCLEVIFFG